ncbi:MAG: YicC family protein [Lachnospiraceae bacterium]|nr:YicC family protein [Lachnospiraceae bacterium]
MLKSMTGFGRCEETDGLRKITVEIKSVNHRYFDMNIRMPKKLNFFEAAIRNLVKNYAQRGKIDMFITYEDLTEGASSLKCNEALAAEYLAKFKSLADNLGVDNDIRVSTFLRCPEVFSMDEQSIDEDALWSLLEKAVKGACEKFVETRIAEGEALKVDLLQKLDLIYENVLFIEERSPEVIKEYRQKLYDKVSELLENTQIDESRILTEVTIYADRICVDEEMVRLKTHIEAIKTALSSGDGIGRKLDFLAQELNREANTTLSKSNDISISDRAIDIKTDIEKIREQVQNIE